MRGAEHCGGSRHRTEQPNHWAGIQVRLKKNKVSKSIYEAHAVFDPNAFILAKSTRIYISFFPCSIFTTLQFTIKLHIQAYLSLLMCILTGEVNSVGEIPPPINWAACVDVAVPGPTLWRPVLVMEPGWMLGWFPVSSW